MEITDMSKVLSELPEETLRVMGDAVHKFLDGRPDIEDAIPGIALKSAIIEAEQRQSLANEQVTLKVKSVQPAFPQRRQAMIDNSMFGNPYNHG